MHQLYIHYTVLVINEGKGNKYNALLAVSTELFTVANTI